MRISVATLLPFVSALHVQQQTPLQGQKTVAPAIGLHLTNSYGLAAIRHEDGTVEDLVRIKGKCDIEDSKREKNKANGKPANEAVERLALFLIDLKKAAEKKLDKQVKFVYPVLPVLAGMDERDLRDALEYAGLEWSAPVGTMPFYETTGAYVGMGHGLCALFQDKSDCRKEEKPMQMEHVLFLNFDNSSFSAAYQPMQMADRHHPNAYVLEPYLGWWYKPANELPRADFWTEVASVITDVVDPIRIIPSKIVLLGDYAYDKKFQKVTKKTLWKVLQFDASNLMKQNEAFNSKTLAVRGAAELAFRLARKNGQSGDATSIEEIAKQEAKSRLIAEILEL